MAKGALLRQAVAGQVMLGACLADPSACCSRNKKVTSLCLIFCSPAGPHAQGVGGDGAHRTHALQQSQWWWTMRQGPQVLLSLPVV